MLRKTLTVNQLDASFADQASDSKLNSRNALQTAKASFLRGISIGLPHPRLICSFFIRVCLLVSEESIVLSHKQSVG